MTIVVLQPKLASADVNLIHVTQNCEAIWIVYGVVIAEDMKPGIFVSHQLSVFGPVELIKCMDEKPEEGFPQTWETRGGTASFYSPPYRVERIR